MGRQHTATSIFGIGPRAKTPATVSFAVALTILATIPTVHAQTLTILHTFTGGQDGGYPETGLTMDRAGNLYGTTCDSSPPHYDGNVFQDAAGNFFSTTEGGGTDGVGVVFEMTSSGGGWTYDVLYNFLGNNQFYDGPLSPLVSDAQGNLYGDTLDGGIYGGGSVFKLTPTEGGWVYTSLHDFNCTAPEGCGIFGPLVMDADGNIYGTANGGGAANCGNGYGCDTVWEITP